MVETLNWYILFTAFILDFIFADPHFLPHPVVFMGNAISYFEIRFRKVIQNPFYAGLAFSLSLIISTYLISFAILKLSFSFHYFLGQVVSAIALFFCFSSKSLEKAAKGVFNALEENNIVKARQMVAMIVGRETNNLDETAVTRASIETVAENFVDGFLSPLFFFLIGGVPAALAYKMINTLDSMVGYQNEKYMLFGRASAKIDDIANFVPARISVLFIALASALFSVNKGKSAFKTGFMEGRSHKSPNAGFPEAGFAGALAVRLGGPSTYHGTLVEKPYIGKRFKDPEKSDIIKACDVMMLSSFLATLFGCILLLIV